MICFSRVPINHQTAILFSHLSISAKLALLAVQPPWEEVEEQIHAVDTLLKRKISANWSVLTKAAFFDGQSGVSDIARFWVQTEFTF